VNTNIKKYIVNVKCRDRHAYVNKKLQYQAVKNRFMIEMLKLY